jgi:hypothetical protein
MVLLGFEPMTFEWDACHKALRASKQPTEPNALSVSGLKTRVDITLVNLNF